MCLPAKAVSESMKYKNKHACLCNRILRLQSRCWYAICASFDSSRGQKKCLSPYLHSSPRLPLLSQRHGLGWSASSSVERCGVWSVLYRLFSQNGVLVLRGQRAYPLGKKLTCMGKRWKFMGKINNDPGYLDMDFRSRTLIFSSQAKCSIGNWTYGMLEKCSG